MRNDYNNDKSSLKLLVLTFCSFNYQIRFNSKNEFNMPCGYTTFNLYSKYDELKNMFDIISKHEIVFSDYNFIDFNLNDLHENDFVYCDPPYLITEAVYNSGWQEKEEKTLYDTLDNLNERNIKFGLSNVI